MNAEDVIELINSSDPELAIGAVTEFKKQITVEEIHMKILSLEGRLWRF